MSKMTLLEMTQDVLSSLSSDEVNTFGATTESLQIATIIKNKYFDIIARGDLPDKKQIFQLDPSLDSTKPVMMFTPDGVNKVEWIKYFDTSPLDSLGQNQFGSYSHGVNTNLTPSPGTTSTFSPTYQYVTILPVDQFLDMTNRFNILDTDVQSFLFTEGGRNFTFYYRNDHQPKYCTIISNFYVIFDAYDNTQDTTLQTSKTMCFGSLVPPFLMQDTFIPDALEENQFPLLLNEVKAWAFYELKQQPHAKAEQELKRQWSTLQRDKSLVNRPSYFDQLPDYGRQPRTGGYGTIWPKITQSMN